MKLSASAYDKLGKNLVVWYEDTIRATIVPIELEVGDFDITIAEKFTLLEESVDSPLLSNLVDETSVEKDTVDNCVVYTFKDGSKMIVHSDPKDGSRCYCEVYKG